MFASWLKSTDTLLHSYAAQTASGPNALSRTSPSFFERNLHVWRQLWRVTETSSIILILVDVRFPLIHWPPSLEAHVRSLGKPYILVLTKTDLVPRWLAEAWQRWFLERAEQQADPSFIDCVLMTSYRETERTALTQGTQPRFIPAAPTSARAALLSALRRAHELILQRPVKPDSVSAEQWEQRMARWTPKVRQEVDWDAVEDERDVARQLQAQADAKHAEQQGLRKEKLVEKKKSRRAKDRDVYVPRPTPAMKAAQDAKEAEEAKLEAERQKVEEQEMKEAAEGDQDGEYVDPRKGKNPLEGLTGDDAHPYITIGLIGQPNVGKSSLLVSLQASDQPPRRRANLTFSRRTRCSARRLCGPRARRARPRRSRQSSGTGPSGCATALAWWCPAMPEWSGRSCPASSRSRLVRTHPRSLGTEQLLTQFRLQNVEPVLYYVSQRMPLEKILKLRHPDAEDDEFSLQLESEGSGPRWTADELLTEYAVQQGTPHLLLTGL